MFALWIYAVPVVTASVLHAGAGPSEYQRGLVMVSAGFAGYAVLAATLAFRVPGLVRRFGNGLVHGIALVIGGVGLAGLGLARSPGGLVPAFVAIGIGWSSMQTVPYEIASALAPAGGGARFMRLFSLSTVAPQVICTIGLALLAPVLSGRPALVLLAGGAAMAGGGLLTLALRGRLATVSVDW